MKRSSLKMNLFKRDSREDSPGKPIEEGFRLVYAAWREVRFQFLFSQVPPVDPVLLHHLNDFIQSPRASPGGMRPQRAGPTPQRAEPTPQRLDSTPSRASLGHQRPRRTLRVDPVQGSSQARLAFNIQPSESIRAASFFSFSSFFT